MILFGELSVTPLWLSATQWWLLWLPEFTLSPACSLSHDCQPPTLSAVWERLFNSSLPAFAKVVSQSCFKTFPKLSPSLSTGAMGEAGQRGGDTSDQVLHPVEEAKREGDTTGNHRQRKSKTKTPSLLHITCNYGRGRAMSWQQCLCALPVPC